MKIEILISYQMLSLHQKLTKICVMLFTFHKK